LVAGGWETGLVPYSAMARWVKKADQTVMPDGCFLKCVGRIINNLTDEEKIVHIDALSMYKKYTDVFFMEEVPEAERNETARQVADKILSLLKDTLTVGTTKQVTEVRHPNTNEDKREKLRNTGCGE
jgi:hypothetical protein